MKERDELEDLFRERFSEKETPVSPRVWNNIKNSLPPEGKGKTPFWKNTNTYFGIVAVSLLAGILCWWVLSSDAQKNVQPLSEELAIAEHTNAHEENSTNNTGKMNLSENRKEVGSENLNTATEIIEGRSKEQDRSSEEKNSLKENSTSTTKPVAEINENGNTQARRGKEQRNVSTKGLSDKGNKQNGTSGKKSRGEFVAHEVVNGSDKNGNTTGQKEKFPSNGSDRTKNNPKPGNFQKQNGKTVDGRGHALDQQTANKNGNNNNNNNDPVMAVNDQKLKRNETSSLEENPVSGDKAKNNVDKKEDNNNLVSEENQLAKNATSSSMANTALKDEGKNKNELSDKDKKVQNSKAIQNGSTVTLKENEKLHELSDDSSLSVQNGHMPTDQMAVKNNADSDQKEIVQDSVANAPLIAKASPDSISPVIDTLAETKADSTLSADSTIQKEKEKSPKLSRWSVDIVLGPMLTGATTQANDLSYEGIVNAKNQQDKNSLNFSGGGMVNYAVSPMFYFSTGILYSGYSEKYNFRNTKDTISISTHIEMDSVKLGQDTFYTQIPREVHDTSHVSNEYHDKKTDQYSFISVPFHVSMYLWRRERLALLASAGIRANLAMKHTTYITNGDMTALTEYSGGIQKISLSYMASVALEYQLKKKMYLVVQPAFNYQAGSVYTKSSVLNQKPYAIGMNVGLRFKF